MLQKRLGDLVTLLNALLVLYRELSVILDEKLSAMRSAEMEAVQALQVRERRLVERIQERNGLRRQLMELIGAEFGIGKAAASEMSLRDLAARVPEPRKGHLLVMADQLRETMRGVEGQNRKIGVVSTVMLKHLALVFEAMTRSPEDPGVYTSGGRRANGTGSALFSMVG